MSKPISIRLNEQEVAQLDEMATASNTGTENRTEFIRLLLKREWHRRKGLPKPEAKDYQTAFRNGSPKRFNV